jgi:hypothetical protein
MKKRSLITAMILMVLMSSASYGVTPAGPLSVSGNKIVNSNGDPVSFAGMSFFWSNDGWGGMDYYNVDCVNWLVSDWEVTIVRAAMGVEDSGGYIDSPTNNKNRLITVVDAAIAAGIYVIIDWHSHHAENNQSAAISFFQEMATTYGGYDNVIYEIYNEPWGSKSWSGTVKPYSEAVIAAIRAIDSDNLIIVGSPEWSQRVDLCASDPITGYSNLAYTVHFYPDMGHTQWLRDRCTAAMNSGIALMATEWGDGSPGSEIDTWMAYLASNGISHMNWAVNDKNESLSCLKPEIGLYTGGWTAGDLTASGTEARSICRDWEGIPSPPPEGDNLALNQPTTCSSTESGSYGPENAVDGSTSTRWSSEFDDPEWIYVDLGEELTITAVRLNWEAAYGSAYQIQVSNNASDWTDVYSTSSGNGGIDDIDFADVNARYVRMYGTGRGTSYGFSLWEFGVYGVASAYQESGGACVMEAENAAVAQRTDTLYWYIDTGHSGYVGDSYMTTQDNVSGSFAWSGACEMAWKVDISTAGTYYMAVRRLALDNGDDSAQAGVDGVQRDDNTFNGPTGSAWQWKRGTDFDLGNLSAGTHTIQIRRREDGFCVDRVMIADSLSKLPADGSTENGPPESPTSGEPPDTTPPAAPTGLSATAGDATVSLDWDDNSEPDLAVYDVYRSTNTGGPYSVIDFDLTSSDYTDNSVSNGTTYYYVVTAIDTSSNESGYSNEDSATPEADTTPPAAPTGLAATAGDATVSLDWNDNGEGDLDGYNVYRSTTSGSGYSQLNGSLVGSSDYIDNSVSNGTTYYYVVTAVDTSTNESGYSSEASATPQAAPATALHVADIAMSTRARGPNVNAIATVTVVDAGGVPVEGATVSGHWSGLTSDSDSGITVADGTVSLSSNKLKNPSGTFTFTVDNITKAGWTYDSAANVETSDSITVP